MRSLPILKAFPQMKTLPDNIFINQMPEF